jgi:hypothetical protein
MTRAQLTDKLLDNILNLDGNSGAKDLVLEYFGKVYNFSAMEELSIQVIPEGSAVKHIYYEGPNINVPDIVLFSHTSAKEVLDAIITNIDRLKSVGATEIVVGVRSANITQIGFAAPNYYFGAYSFSGTNDREDYWIIEAPSMPPKKVLARGVVNRNLEAA